MKNNEYFVWLVNCFSKARKPVLENMMNSKFSAFLLLGSVALSGQAIAGSTWTLGTTYAAGGGVVSAAGTSVTATVTGWADTTNDMPRELQQQDLTVYSPGLGITNKDACGSTPCDSSEFGVPEHAIDNNGRYEMALLSFAGEKVNLTDANFSYTGNWDNSSYGSNFTVLAYTGDAGGESLVDKTWGTLTGWTVIGNYASNTSGNKDIDNTIYSSFWLIGAYNPMGGVADTAYSKKNGYNYYSAFKLASVTATVCAPGVPGCGGGGGNVPEPGSIALVGLGLLGLIRVRANTRK